MLVGSTAVWITSSTQTMVRIAIQIRRTTGLHISVEGWTDLLPTRVLPSLYRILDQIPPEPNPFVGPYVWPATPLGCVELLPQMEMQDPYPSDAASAFRTHFRLLMSQSETTLELLRRGSAQEMSPAEILRTHAEMTMALGMTGSTCDRWIELLDGPGSAETSIQCRQWLIRLMKTLRMWEEHVRDLVHATSDSHHLPQDQSERIRTVSLMNRCIGGILQTTGLCQRDLQRFKIQLKLLSQGRPQDEVELMYLSWKEERREALT